MTPIEFLTERLAADADRARSCRNWAECDPGYGCPAHLSPARLLAEVETKRQIIALAEEWRWDRDDTGPDPRSDQVLRPLLALYADHPDFQPDWR